MSVYEIIQLLAFFAVPIGAGALGLLVYRIRAIQSSLDGADARLDLHGERLAALEAHHGAMEHLRGDVKGVHGRVDEVLADVREVKGTMHALDHTVRIIQRQMMGSDQ